jgi:hypothetical protein
MVREVNYFVCELCLRAHPSMQDANECEVYHKEHSDVYWDAKERGKKLGARKGF